MQVSEGDVVTSMFELQNFLTGAVSGQLQHITPISAGVLFVAGLSFLPILNRSRLRSPLPHLVRP